MTKPRLANDKGRDGVRTYGWPPIPPHELQVVSVTSALDNFPKPWLAGWAVKVTAQRAVDDVEIWQAMVAKDNEAGALKYIKDARWSSAGGKADRGSVVHGALEAYIAGKAVVKAEVDAQLEEKNVPYKLRAATHKMILGLMNFLEDEEPDIYWSETSVFSRTHGYGGTPDIVGRMRINGELQPVIIDVKTSPRIYADTALQLCAYSRADFVGLDDGTEMPLLGAKDNAHEPTNEPIKYGVVVRPDPKLERGYEKGVFALESEDDELFETFLNCLALAGAEAIVQRARRL